MKRAGCLVLIMIFPLIFTPPAQAFYRGVTLTSWTSGELSAPEAQDSLKQLKNETGVNAVLVLNTFYVERTDSSTVFLHPAKSHTKEEMAVILAKARDMGFSTGIKCHVDVLTIVSFWIIIGRLKK